MPPKPKFSRDEILNAAFEIVREDGKNELSARSLAARLNSSTQPIFMHFQNMNELLNEVKDRAKALYKQYVDEGLSQAIPFKSVGLKYIQFAKDEPELFKLLFMSADATDKKSHFFPTNDDNYPIVLSSLKDCYGLDEDKAKKLYNHLSIYTHGMAITFVQGRQIFSMQEVSDLLSEVFIALMKNITSE